MHIPQDELQKFQSGTMDTEEMIHFLEHMEQCDFCLDQLLQEEETASAPAPSYLQEEIMKKASSPEVTASRKIRENRLLVPASLCRFTYRCWNGCGTDHAFFCITE